MVEEEIVYHLYFVIPFSYSEDYLNKHYIKFSNSRPHGHKEENDI